MSAPDRPEIPDLHFAAGLPGFPGARRFALVQWGDADSPFSVLRDLEDESVQFLVVHPAAFFPDYTPELDDAAVEALGLTAADDAILLVILTLGDRPEDATANLLGPIVINRRTRQAAQVVVGDGWDTRQPLAAGTAR